MMVMVMVMVMAVMMLGDRVGGGEDQAAGFDALGADEVVGQLADHLGSAAEEDDLQASPGVEMDVGGGDDGVEVSVLDLGQAFGDAADVVVVVSAATSTATTADAVRARPMRLPPSAVRPP